MGAAKSSCNMSNEVSEGENVNEQPAEDTVQSEESLIVFESDASVLFKRFENLFQAQNEQIHNLHGAMKLLESKLTELELTSSRERADLVRRHEEMMEQIKEEHEAEIASLKQQFVSYSEKKEDTHAVVPTKNQKLAAKLLGKFKELSRVQQGLVVVGMIIVIMTVGYYSWSFMVWAWPLLIDFAARIDVAGAGVAGWLFAMMNSAAFKKFMKAWENGEPLGPAFFNSFGPEIRSAINSMAQYFFRISRPFKANFQACDIANFVRLTHWRSCVT